MRCIFLTPGSWIRPFLTSCSQRSPTRASWAILLSEYPLRLIS